ncbi:HdeD family acid-resistance protein [Cellulomonas sp. P22]|uniref:HdeD family acid-resistance protein n=1 Tax=Cellulomonas sp. P22 TaxID=3373189 RepID=UPI00378CADE9
MADDAVWLVARRREWWLPVLRGVLLVVLGFLMLVEPLATVSTLVWVFGVFAVVDGLIALGQGFLHRGTPGAPLWMVQGLVGVAFGVVIVLWPGPTALVLFYLLAIWVLVLGVFSVIGAASMYRSRDQGWTWALASGLVAVLFGLFLVLRPQDTVEVLVVVFGLFAFVLGAVLTVSGFALRERQTG